MEGTRGSLDEILAWLRSQKFTGAIVVHFAGGIPQIAEYGRPSRFQIVPDLVPVKNPLTPPTHDP